MERFDAARMGRAMAAIPGMTTIGDDPHRWGVLPTGIDAVDALTGVGGLPRGKITLLHGPSSSGKSTIALHASAEAQRQGGVAIYFDFEGKLDLDYSAALGVDIAAMGRPKPEEVSTIEGAFKAIEAALRFFIDKHEGVPIVIVWDSLHSAVSGAESRTDWEEGGYPGEAKAYSRCLRKLTGIIGLSGVVLVFISQQRMDLGSPAKGAQTIGVGKAPLHASALCLVFSKPRATGKDGILSGDSVTIRTEKNHLAPRRQKVDVLMSYGIGFEPASSLMEAGVLVGEFSQAPKKSGTGVSKGWYVSASEGAESKRFQGAGGLRRMKDANPERYEALREVVRKRMQATDEE